jgi:RNA-binding protein
MTSIAHMTSAEIKKYRALAHPLKPVVIIGQAGLTESVLTEINNALEHHELIKIRVNALDRENRSEITNQILTSLNATLIQQIGHTVSIYRKREN